MSGYLIYHPRRQRSMLDDVIIYHDSPNGNQDPYIWNNQFLHSYCHITQMKACVNHINFWVSGDCFPNFMRLYCDLVFVVKEKIFWPLSQTNSLEATHPIVDSKEAFVDHYQWPERGQHIFQGKRRFTLKADPLLSFQPQDSENKLIDILPYLLQKGFLLQVLRREIRSGTGACPFPLDDSTTTWLYEQIKCVSHQKLLGQELQDIRQRHLEELSSDRPRKRRSSKKMRD